MGEGDLREFLKTLTDKPIEVIISHAHPDHILQAGLFDKVYMSSKENEVLKSFGINIDTSRFSDIRDVDMIDLGDRILEVIEVSGHTPGSIVLLDKKNGLLFTGDAIGSGELWMQVPGARTLKSYLESLGKLEGRKGEFSKIYVGHMWIIKPFSPDYLNDVKTAVEKVLNGELEGKPYPIGVFGGLCVTVGSATLVYNADNVR
jgi:glyoxylase-like metal-dependent hydrolase (beta-lactamase superfamily II)